MNPILIILVVAVVVFKVVASKNSLKKTDVEKLMANGGKIIDVRSPMEYKSGKVKAAKNIEHHKILAGVKKAKISKDTPIILYCASGSRASVAKSTLKSGGYTEVHNAGSFYKASKLLA